MTRPKSHNHADCRDDSAMAGVRRILYKTSYSSQNTNFDQQWKTATPPLEKMNTATC